LETLELEILPVAFLTLKVARSDQRSEVNVETMDWRQDERKRC